VVEDEELATAGDIADDSLADEGVGEVAPLAPEVEVRADREPAKGATVVLPGVGKWSCRLDLDVVAGRICCRAELPNEANVDACFFLHLSDGCFGDGLTLLDPASGHDGRVLRHSGDVEHEELVGTRLRMFARDVGGDGRAGSQLCSARIFAL
jgi:hypothetical protein